METVRLLLDAGADSRLRNSDGRTPGEIAEELGHATVAELLRQA
jgi:ankyrin repeat protein